MYHSVICIQYFTVIVLQAEILDKATLFFLWFILSIRVIHLVLSDIS